MKSFAKGKMKHAMVTRSRSKYLKVNDPAYILNLPSEITIEILTRLPTRTIISCKCVCKTWLGVLSSAEFAYNHHYLSSHGLSFLRMPNSDTTHLQVPRMNTFLCKVVEYECVPSVQRLDLISKPTTVEFDLRAIVHPVFARLAVGGSVDGLLFLRAYGYKIHAFYICNPITREYIRLPALGHPDSYLERAMFGFGACASNGQYNYKVVNIFHRRHSSKDGRASSIESKPECMVYTLGTGLWRTIATGEPCEYFRNQFATYLNGNLHWLVKDVNINNKRISCFDLETESLQSFSLPPRGQFEDWHCPNAGIIVLEDSLCYCKDEFAGMLIWSMKEYGVSESWTLLFNITQVQYLSGPLYDLIYPLKVLGNTIVLFCRSNYLAYYSHKTKTACEVEVIKPVTDGCFVPVHHKPSFLSLERFVGEIVYPFESYLED